MLGAVSAEQVQQMFCAHGAKHAFGRLGWICDVASCVRAFPNLRWTEVLAASERAGTMRELLLGLKLAADLFGVRLPPTLPSDHAVAKLVRFVRNPARSA